MMGVNVGQPGVSNGTINNYAGGWGERIFTPGTTNTPGTENLNGYFNTYLNQGTWTLGSGSLPLSGSSQFGYTSTAAVTQMSGSVSGTLGHTLSGPMTFVGSLLNGTSFSYSGLATIDSGGRTVFNYTGSWAGFPNGETTSFGTATGTIYQYPGYYFTQTMPGSYQQNTTDNGFNGTLSVSGASGSRSLVYGGSFGPFSGSFDLSSPTGSLPASTTAAQPLASDLVMQGVVSDSKQGAVSGNASLSINTGSLNLVNIPGQVSLTNGGSFFTPFYGVVPNLAGSPIQVMGNNQGAAPSNYLTQSPVWNFTQTYNGFRISTTLADPTLASAEGYGWGLRTSTNLPTNYTGYFVAQDLGTRASATPLPTNWAGVTGTMTATLSGAAAAGETLSGQMTFSGTSTNGTTFTYSGPVSLFSDGRLLANYYGNWLNGSQSGTGSGNLVEVAGTYFTESVTGGYQQTSTTGTAGAPNTTTVVSTTPLVGTRTVGGSPIATTASEGAMRTSTVNTFSTAAGTTTVAVEGVVAGPTFNTQWGVATMTPTNTPTGGTSSTTTPVTGTVTIDPAGTLTGQFVGQVPNGDGSSDVIGRNLVSVTQASGLSTSAFTQTATGTLSQTPVPGTSGSQAIISTPIPLTGVSTGTITGPINTNVSITSTALQANTFNNAISPTITATAVGAVGGPVGGVQTGVATIQAVTTNAGTTSTNHLVGTTTLQPATGTAPAALTTVVSGINSGGTNPTVNQGTITATKQ